MIRWFLINNTACDAATGKLTGECQTYWSCSDDENVGHLCIGHRIVFSFRFSHISLCSDESILVLEVGGYRLLTVADAAGGGIFWKESPRVAKRAAKKERARVKMCLLMNGRKQKPIQ